MNKLLRALAVVGALFVASDALAEGASVSAYVGSTSVTGANAGTNALVFNNEVLGYGVATIQFTSIGSGNTVTFEGSNDNVTWFTTPGNNVDGTTHTGAVSPSLTVIPVISLPWRYWRARLSTYSSGTVAGVVTYKASGVSPDSVSGANDVVVGDVASGAADGSSKPVKVGTVFNTSLPAPSNGQRVDAQSDTNGAVVVSLAPGNKGIGASALNTDGQTAAINGFRTFSAVALNNGATLDIARTVANSTNSVGTGITAAGLLAQFDDVTPQAPTENSWTNLRESADHGLYTSHVKGDGTLTEGNFACTSFAAISVTGGNTTQIVGLSASTVIRVCTIVLDISVTGTGTILSGTGANCGTPANSTGAFGLLTSTPFVLSDANGAVYRGTAGGELCIAAATGNISGYVMYAQY